MSQVRDESGQILSNRNPAPLTLRLASNATPLRYDFNCEIRKACKDGGGGTDTARVTITVTAEVVLDTRGTDFGLALPGNLSGYADSVFSISAEAPVRGKIEIFGLNFSRNFTVGSASSTDVQVPHDALIATDGETENK